MYTIVAPIPDNLETALMPYRQKYDPLAHLIPAHLTLLRPFDFSGDDAALQAHLHEVGEHQAPIKVSLAGWDILRRRRHLLTLPIIAGYDEFVSLRQHLLDGPLSALSKQDVDYRPHIVFGRLDAAVVDRVKQDLRAFEPQFIFRVTHIDLLQRSTVDEPWRPAERVALKGTVMSLPRPTSPQPREKP